MANLPVAKEKVIRILSQYVNHFEIDADNMRIRVSAYDRDENVKMIEGSARSGQWVDLFANDEKTIPNLPQEHWQTVATVLPLLTQLAVEYGKVSGVIDKDAIV